MRRKVFVSIFVLVMFVMSLTVQAFAQPPDEVETPSAEKMLELVNEFRAEENQGALRLSKTLCEAANERAAEMAREKEISHVRPDGTIFDTTLEVAGDKGENVFRGGPLTASEVPEKAFLGWRDKSIDHRQNMLDSSWGYMGAGYALGEDGYWYVCQLFSQTRPVTDEPESSDSATNAGDNKPDATASQAPAIATPAPTIDPSKLLQWIEAPDEVTAGETITFKVVTSKNVNMWYYSPTWSIYPSRYKTDVSRDLTTMTLRTKTEDTITVEFRIKNGGVTEKVSKTVWVHNAVHAEITGPDQVMPGKRATVQLDTIAGVGPQDISWSVIPGLCALDFSADKRSCTFVSPSDANVLFIAKVKLKDSVATAKKTVKVVSELPVELTQVTKGQVGYELEVHVDVDHRVMPGSIYWSMYPGTCDARFAPDKRTMYFTPTNTDTLEITVRAEYEGKSGAAFLVVPVADSSTPAPTATPGNTSAPLPVVTSQPAPSAVTTADPNPAASATSEAQQTAAPTSTASAAPTSTVSETSTPAPTPVVDKPTDDVPAATAAPTSTAPLPILTPGDPTEPTGEPPLLPVLNTGPVSPSGTSDQPDGPGLLPLLTDDPAEPTQGVSADPAGTTAPSTTSTDAPQYPTAGEVLPFTPAETTGDESTSSIQLAQDAKISLQQPAGASEPVAVMQLADQLTVQDVLASFASSDAQAVCVVNENGEAVPADASPATGQMVQVRDENGQVVEIVPIIVPGDVLGTGKMGISQLVRAASAFTGKEPLTGVYLKALKMTGSDPEGTNVTLGDIVRMVQLLSAK